MVIEHMLSSAKDGSVLTGKNLICLDFLVSPLHFAYENKNTTRAKKEEECTGSEKSARVHAC
jgi:hypothetical protein